MLWLLVGVPLLAGAVVWSAERWTRVAARRLVLGAFAVAGLLATLAVALWAAATDASAAHTVGGGLRLLADVAGPAAVIAVLVPVVGAPIVAYAAAQEPLDGLGRLLGLLTAFVGVMELLVVAADWLTLTVAFELTTGLSWALIAHEWRRTSAARAAAVAFNATRFGGLGLFLAAGASYAATGSLAFSDLPGVAGGLLDVLVAGVVLACAAKAAQLPFAPWLFAAMAGPTPVSALLHSSTMVAAGAYVLIRLQPALDRVAWFAPVVIAVGLVTAVAAGAVALLQAHAKRLLAASTSAQYGLMFVAVGAGYPAVAALHLVVHALVKAALFLAAGVAIRAVSSPMLGRMRLRRSLPATAALAAVASLGLAAVPPLGGGWSKEAIVAAAGGEAAWLALAVVVAGALSAAYATRFQLLAFGGSGGSGPPPPRPPLRTPTSTEQAAIGLLVAGSAALGLLWWRPAHELAARALGGEVPAGEPWQLAASLTVTVLAVYGVWALDRRRRLGHVGTEGRSAAAGAWLGLPAATRHLVVTPALASAAAVARFDDHVVEGGVRLVGAGARRTAGWLADGVEPRLDDVVAAVAAAGQALASASERGAERAVDGAVAAVAWLVDRAGADARRSHTGMVHHQFVVIAAGVVVVVAAVALGR
ncbi:MAG: NADH-quinone oxidoreductase subunit L [Actinobacteria bacterium]|nr:NADH-quinone oxidoreductase subunit L [Actinomycetota bacterium]